MYIMGYDVGSSSIKATLMEAESGKIIASVSSPKTELEIIAVRPGWAEQNPIVWWENIKNATSGILSESTVNTDDIKAIGISYQMHGLVIVDKKFDVLRPSIIWCDSRAVDIGEKAFKEIGQEKCLKHLLNSPGNFTASKLKWVKENEPDIFSKIHKAMLPGDYIAMKMTGEIKTTQSGLSEGILWDYDDQDLAKIVLEYYGFPYDLIPEIVPTFSIQGELIKSAAEELGLKQGTKISYRAGDQPNNALSLNVLNPGEIAATAGTSGVIYCVTDKANNDSNSRVNTFVHVNNKVTEPRYGVLLCINGTGILNSWLKHNIMSLDNSAASYKKMNEMASNIAVGSDGLVIIPYGNGAERTLGNVDIGASIRGWQFNIHTNDHILRAAQEGIVFALNYGLQITRDMGVTVSTVRAGNANMFLSPVFREAFATVTDAVVELYNTDGSQGAARGAGIGAGLYKTIQDAFIGLNTKEVIDPRHDLSSEYEEAYSDWVKILGSELESRNNEK